MSEHIDDQNRKLAGNGEAAGRYAECVYVQDLASGYALGALEEDDHQLIADHVSTCSPCRDAIAHARQAVALLPFASPSAIPPLHTKAALFTRIAQTSRAQAADLPTVTIPASNAETTMVDTTAQRWRLPLFGKTDSRNHRSRFYLPLLATVPLVVALALLGNFAMSSQGRVDDLESQLTESQQALDTVNGFNARTDTMVYDLPGQNGLGFGGAHGTVLANRGSNEAMLMVAGLSPEPEDGRYLVLLEDDDGYVVQAAEFGVDGEGRSAVELNLTQPFNSYRTLHIKRVSDGQDLISSQMPSGDALYARIAPEVEQILERISASAE